MKKKTFLAVIFSLAMVQTSSAQSFSPQLAAMLQDTLNKYVALITNIKGMSVAVYLPEHGIWKGTSGVSSAGQPITADMEFGIASNTKLFVAAALLKLAENNIFSLDDSLHKWLPAYPNINSNITIRQLLHHKSGVSDPLFVSPFMDTIMNNPTRVFTPNEVLGWVGAPLFAAGTSWGYSNINYILAGMVAESATGYHISKIIRDSILTPLNLDSTFYDVKEPILGTLTHRWFNGVDYNTISRVGLNTAGGCAGALFSTAGEMVQWYHALFSGEILNAASLADLTTFVTTGTAYTYGLGLENQTYFGNITWGHGGTTWGYKSRMVYEPCSGVVVCGLANSWPAGMDGVTLLLYKVVVDYLPACAETITGFTTVCQEQNSVTYTVSAIAKATSYQWTLPTGATGTSNTNSITVNYSLSALSGNVTVKGINTYGDGGASTLAVTVNDIHLALCGGKTISGIIITETNKPVSGVSVILSGSESDIVLTGIDGFFSFAVMQVGNYTVTPFKTNDVATNNGVTTTDIALIRKHVINITPFNSPYKIIAADASNNSIASTADIPLVRQVILNSRPSKTLTSIDFIGLYSKSSG
ncbi:MAG: serine hydrolase [Chitinophagales bacterium]|nr:serine hydrolase [Chitinophagales bacterium]